MSTRIKQEELLFLQENFRFSFEKTGSPLSVQINQLQDEYYLHNFLLRVQKKISAPNLTVAASIFAKRYSFMMAVPALYLMSTTQKQVDVSLNNTYIESDNNENTWLPRLRLANTEVSNLTSRDEYLQQIFKNNVSVVIDAILKTVPISKNILWENTAIYIFWLYETFINESFSNTIKEQAMKDLHYIVNVADGTLFGQQYNPLKPFYHAKQKVPWLDKEVRVRTTCCLNHCITNKLCKSCPKNKF